ncbi:four helix bundle protein [Patescibacteria group bacterium]|nr:four helix bundle protein [Patescibacteria group bacterium]
MVLAEYLPVYKASYDMTLALFHVIKKYPKEFKYTLGEQMKKDSLALIATIYKANSILERKTIIIEARGHLESVRVLLRLSKDLHTIPLDKFVDINGSLETISKQLTARNRSIKSM